MLACLQDFASIYCYVPFTERSGKLPEQTQAHMILKSKKYEVPDAEKKDVYNILQQAHTCTYSDSYPSNMANQSDVLRSLSAPLRSASSKGQASKDGMPDLRPKRCCKRKGVATRAKRLSSQHDEAGGASNTLDYTSHLMFTEFLGCTILVQEKFTCAILYYLYIFVSICHREQIPSHSTRQHLQSLFFTSGRTNRARPFNFVDKMQFHIPPKRFFS